MTAVIQTELRTLMADLTRAQSRAVGEVTAVVNRGALNIKADWAARWSGMAHAPALPAAVTYDMVAWGMTIRAEIGPDKARRQGALANLIEFGSIKNAPRPGGLPALAAEQPRLEAALAAIADPLRRG